MRCSAPRAAVILRAGVAVRAFTPAHQLYAAEDWFCDIGGALAALSPILIGEFRKSFTPRPPPPVKPTFGG
jgi:hypothetical protein